MDRYKLFFVFVNLLSICSCEISYETKNKLVNGFIDFYNSLPDQIYTCEEGFLKNAQQTQEINCYEIEANLKVSQLHNLESTKYLKCNGTVVDLDDVGVAVMKHHCEETTVDNAGGTEEAVGTETSTPVSEAPYVRTPIQLDNEIQTNIAVTSGEQFIAIPREEPKVHCIGCSSHVNPQALGVEELASIGVRQLNLLEPQVQHTLHSVLDVERQVQVVNGIRYILTLIIDYNSCTTPETESCIDSKTCKITFLEKPWMQLPDGSKYRAVLANNCTEEWRFGDNGVIVPQTPTDNRDKNNINPSESTDGVADTIKPIHNVDVQSLLQTEKILTVDDIKAIEQQIIPHKVIDTSPDSDSNVADLSETSEAPETSKEHLVKVESETQLNANSIPSTNSVKIENLSDDKKKAIDDMLSFFNFAGLDSVHHTDEDEKTRVKRSYDKDLNVMNLVEKFQKLKRNVRNANHVYKLAESVVDYLNEMDLEVKSRVLIDVINAEEEFENHQHFYYVQTRVKIPCDKSECEKKDTILKICNAVLAGTGKNVQILSVFCHDDSKTKPVGKVNSVPLEDPVLHKLIKESIEKIESESSNGNALKLDKIIDAHTQRVSGTLTLFTIILDKTNCHKTIPLVLRSNCTILEELGSQVCEVSIHERHWLKERKITYTCTERPIDSSFSNIRKVEVKKSVNDPVVLDLVHEALQYLEVQSNRNNKQAVVRVNSVVTQLVAGFLTNIEFVVGYTTCTNDVKHDTSNCKLLENEPLRICKAQVWDRTWIEDGRQVDVSCKEPNNEDKGQTKKIKRSLLEMPESQNVNDPQLQELARKSMQKFMKTSGRTKHYDLIKIKTASRQIVAGTKTTLSFTISPTDCHINEKGEAFSSNCKIIDSNDVTNCDSEVWEKPWEQFTNITVTCQINSNARVKRDTLVGGKINQDINDIKYKKLAEKSMQKYLESSGNTKPHKLFKIENVTVHVVSGTLIEIQFKIAPTIESNGDTISCHSRIWQQPWLNKEEINVTCQINSDARVKRDIVLGGPQEGDVNDSEYKKLAEKSMQKYLESSGNTKPHKIVEIKRVTSQVVSGTLIKIKFKIAPTIGLNGDTISCQSDIWQQSWLDNEKITVNCAVDTLSHESSRLKREIFTGAKKTASDHKAMGGLHKQDPTKNEYKLLAQNSLMKYLKVSKNTKHHSVVEVNNVSTQVVSGMMYYIEFIAAPKTCARDISTCENETSVLHCNTKVWDQPWLKKKEIMDVSCSRNHKKMTPRISELRDEHDDDEERRSKRQALEDDDVEEETKFYYAERAIKQLNEQSHSSNLHKLVSIHAVQSSQHMRRVLVRMYLEAAETYCLRRRDEAVLSQCEELDATPHRLCLARIWPSDEEPHIEQISIVCDDDEQFETVTGISVPVLMRASLKQLEKSPTAKYKLVHQGEPQVIPSLDSSLPTIINFVVASSNCSKNIEIDFDKPSMYNCFIDIRKPSKACSSMIWLTPNSRTIKKITAKCRKTESRKRRSIPLYPSNSTADDLMIQRLVQESLDKLEMSSTNRYKQKVLQINSFSTKITSGRVTTIDFDVGYTSCLKFEWVEDLKSCEPLEHMPRRRCIAQVWERLWIDNGRNIEITCEDDEAPLEAHVQFENANTATTLANEALKHIEAKYPHPRKQKVVRIFSLEKQVVAGIHYRMKLEVGPTQCSPLSAETDCELLKDEGNNKFCRVNVWLRPWTEHPPNFRVTCDYQEAASAELYHLMQAEQLFRDFVTTYKPSYVNNHAEMMSRFEIFRANIRKIHELNTHERGTATYGLTRFADLSYEEFGSKYLGLKPSLRDENQVPMRAAEIPHSLRVPDQFDWREYGAVTPVKDQGSCGSCWAFSVTGNIEGQWKMQSGQLVSLSEQELVDCDKLDNGCNGGLPDNAYRAIEQLGGLQLENDYPYEAEDDQCSFNKTLSRVRISGAVNITSNETDMAKWLVQNGPISIGINANAMQFYMGGVSHPWKMLCSPTNLDHGVLIVGYGVKDYPLFHKKLPFWTIKNSWGERWGEQGYYRVFRGDGTCGVNKMASSAVI